MSNVKRLTEEVNRLGALVADLRAENARQVVAITEALNSRQRLARELLNHITGKSYSHDGRKLHAGYCLLCETETPPGEPLQHKPGCLTAEAEEAAK